DLGADIPFLDLVRLIVDAEQGLGALSSIPGYDELTKKPVLLEYPETMCSGLEPAYYEGAVHPYLTQRSVGYALAAHLDLRYDPARFRVVFPIRDAGGVLRGLHGRLVYEGGDLPY